MKYLIKKYGVFYVLTVFMSLSMASTSVYAGQAKKLYPGTITIGMETWTGYFPLIVARDKGFFKEAGLDVVIKRYVSLGELSKDYVAGKMQARATLTLEAVQESIKGMDHKVVLAVDYSDGSDAIVATQNIQNVKDFRGKKVGFEPGTLEEFFLSWALVENEMSLSDITPVFSNPEETAKKLKNGEIDVAISHEPFLSQFLASKDFHIVYSSKDTPGLITDIVTFRTDFIEAHPETVEAVVRAYFKGLVFWKEHPGEVNVMIAKEFQDSPESIGRQIEGIKMLSEEDNVTAFTFAAGLRSLYGNLRQIGKFVLKHGVKGANSLDTDKLIDRQFIKKISERERERE